MQRNNIYHRWAGVIYPTILSYLSGTVNFQWKENFFHFIIDQKIISVVDIEWNILLEKWPFLTQYKLRETVKDFAKTHGKKGAPLYQNIAENLHKMEPKVRVTQEKLDIIDAFEKLRNGN